jgi:hypothetical protein
MNKLSNVAMLVTGAVLALACNKSSDREPETASRSARTSPSEFNNYEMTPASGTRPAAEQLARARCDREQTCSNIGADKTYSSMQDCLARIQNDWKDDLNARECPGGINQHELDECMSQIRSEACGNPLDTLARISECTQGQICIERP